VGVGSGGFLERALHGADAGEGPPVERLEIAAHRRKEHESAGYPDGDSDGPSVEFDCKSLAWH
jgi:hypothetical protein